MLRRFLRSIFYIYVNSLNLDHCFSHYNASPSPNAVASQRFAPAYEVMLIPISTLLALKLKTIKDKHDAANRYSYEKTLCDRVNTQFATLPTAVILT